jgi:uncharacterized protein (DUF2062 family)
MGVGIEIIIAAALAVVIKANMLAPALKRRRTLLVKN